MEIDSGDTAWLLTSSALVLFMTPGPGAVLRRHGARQNVLAMLMKNVVAMGIVTVTWIVIGYSLAFSGDAGGLRIIGDLNLFALGEFGFGHESGLGNAIQGLTIPDNAHMLFQMMFAIITPALIAGAVAERMKFSAWVIFIGVWSIIVYAPVAHWVWGGGFIAADLKAIDFAGGLVVHINAGVAALALVLVLGRRIGWRQTPMRPNALPLTVLGAMILWFGWFGFKRRLRARLRRRSGECLRHHPDRHRGRGHGVGLLRAGGQGASRPRSASPPAPSPGSWRSPPAPASSARCGPWW